MAVLLLGVMAPLLAAGWTDDIDPANPPQGFSWNDVGSFSYWYANSEDKPQLWDVHGFPATTNLIATHVQTDEGRRIAHTHKQYDFGDTGQPTVVQGNRYWDMRYDVDRPDENRPFLVSNGVTNKTNCHAYALKEKADSDGSATPAYEYWINDPSWAYADDFSQRGNPGDVQAGDLLRYGTNDHTTLVITVSGGEPSTIQWKMNASGVYRYFPRDDHGFNTPYCPGDIDQNKTLPHQHWSWHEDDLYGPTVYGND